MKKTSLKSSRLYLILDADVCSYGRLLEMAKRAVANGVDIVQLRDKRGSAKDILEFSRRIKKTLTNRVLYIINDRVDLVKAACADGVHLGRDDLSVAFARKELGKDAVIGVSCQNIAHALRAQRQGADYLGFGSVFKTLTKPHREPMDLKLLAGVLGRMRIPVFAIGGIGLKNIALLKTAGVRRVAVCRAILNADDVSETTQRLKQALIAF